MATRIYTKTGDKGETSLRSGQRVPKTDLRIEAFGEIDELNSFLGTIDLPQTKKVQKDLMKVLAREKVGSQWLEKEIDKMQENLPELHKFIVPTGQIHLARTVCRRAERAYLRMVSRFKMKNSKEIQKYLNRLSDYLFVLARWVVLPKHEL
jgi:cob(I)alamin adenosyltransferase